MAYFTFTDASGETFVIRLDDPAEIAHARALLAGTTDEEARIGGTIVKAPADYNIGWSYRLAPQSIFFFDMSAEVGDSTMRYIENHLDEVGGHLLPGQVWTGWSSTLTGELALVDGGAGNDVLTGSSRADLILARGGNDILFGLGGDDHLAGGAGNDIAFGGAGHDRIGGGTGNDILDGGAGGDLLQGGSESDILQGQDGNDRLLGEAGLDILIGGFGDDRLVGGAEADILEGGDGADRLRGGAGHDVLVGGAGADRFYFETALSRTSNVDAIADFSRADDSIYLDRDVFAAIGPGVLSAAAFRLGTRASDATDRIIYDKADGELFYDPDGSGAAAQILFARLAPGTDLGHADFLAFG